MHSDGYGSNWIDGGSHEMEKNNAMVRERCLRQKHLQTLTITLLLLFHLLQ
jgi:hypothetical protein